MRRWKMIKTKLIHPHYSGEELSLIQAVLESEHLVDGPMTREFESLIKTITGARHAVACTSATTGMEMALRVLGVGPGDEVVIPAFTHPATGLAVLTVGATPVIVDVDLATRNTTLERMREVITDKTRVLMPVSWGGHPLKAKPMLEYCNQRNLYLIDDAACSLGTRWEGASTGSVAHFTVFSFHPRKIIATGDGGCVVTNNSEWADQMASYKNFGTTRVAGRPVFEFVGTNQRFPSILAALGVAQLRQIDRIIARRRELAQRYQMLLAGVAHMELPIEESGAFHNFQTYAVRLDSKWNRDQVMKKLRQEGIEVQIGSTAIHREPVFREAKISGDLKNAENLADQLLALPLHHKLKESDQKFVAKRLMELTQ